jgi:glycosyltransferase involved in cell wall biosynthesis
VEKETELNKPIYSIRAALFDLKDPTRLIAKLPYDILFPETSYETENCSGIVFPTGGFVSKDTLYVYYGASDRYVCLSTGSLKELLSELKQAAIVEKELTPKIQSLNKTWIVFLATYPPRECGIATFMDDLINNFDQLFATSGKAKVVAMNPDLLQTYDYPKKVILQISENKPADYLAAAKKLNKMPEVELVSIQHEFGIFGADYGKNILIFLAELNKPVAVTFHSILPNPKAMVKELVEKIISHADRLIVMTNMSKKLLETVYGASSEKIKIIPHGLHPMPYTDGSAAKQALGLTGQKVLSTFGLLSRDKGIENAIAALPQLIAADPTIVFLVIGATHTVVLQQEGEVYRNQLIAQAIRLGVSDHVIFYNEYLKVDELLKFLQATDIYLALSQNPDQAVSGTLTYALGAGRPIISTPFKQAQEIITPEVGVLVGFQDSTGIGHAVLDLFSNPERLAEMGRTAYFRTRGMTWPNVTLAYMREFIEIVPDLAKKGKSLPIIKLGHLSRLTDDFGIYQFAVLDQPDPQWGYTLDDNARALIVACWYDELQGSTTTKRLANIYLSFLELASNSQGKFFNYFTIDHQADDRRNQEENLEDSESRTLWALAVAAFSKLPAELKKRARALLNRQWDKYDLVISPRSVAFHIKALAIWQTAEPNKEISTQLSSYADFLLDLFNSNSSDDWQWFEQSLSYSNAVLPEALLSAFKATGRKAYWTAGKAALDFLINESFEGGICVPVRQSGWYLRGGEKKLYDQQPEEVSALVNALRTIYDLSGDDFYLNKMNQAFNWFLGNNLLNQVVYSQLTGGCYDGLGERQINLNQGAESTISYLLARLVIDSKRHN